MAVGFVTSAKVASAVSVASFSFSGSLGTGGRAGLVFVVTYANTGVPIDTGATWNGVAMTPLHVGADTNTEPGAVKAYFLDNISNGTVTVTRTNNTVVCSAFAVVASAASATLVSLVKTVGGAGTVTTNGDTSEGGTAASGEVALDDGSPGTNSMRFAAVFTGAATPLAQGTNSTSLQTDDQTSFGSTLVRETTAGQGSRNVGVATGTTDDYAVVAVAVSEAAPKTPQPTALSLIFTGATPTVTVSDNIAVAPSTLALSWTGATPTVAVTSNVLVEPSTLALSVTGATPTVSTPVQTSPPALVTSLGFATPAVATPVQASPSELDFTWTGDTPVVLTPAQVTPAQLDLTLSYDTPDVLTPVGVGPDQFDMVWTGAVPAVDVSSDSDIAVIPDPLDLALTLATPPVGVTDHVYVHPTTLALALSFMAPTVTVTQHQLAVPAPLVLRWRGARPLVVGPKSKTSGAWQPDERLPFPQQSVPKGLPVRTTWATPVVTIGDDGDFMALLTL